ncbi:MAG TPA: aminotransferase class V-fold PLP-dependent enzyme [Holophagaceae bacterium]|nr:aminotransferase class V-fold PLP-dependent enzyme [Holophagaceae bacterium]
MPALLNPALFHFDPDVIWVMHCSEGPVPRVGMRAARAWMQKELRPWDVRWKEDLVGLPLAVRREAAKLLQAEGEDITLTASTSTGLQIVASGYPWQPGDEVLAPLGEFPTNIWPWKAQSARGAGFREAALWEGHRAGAEAWDTTPPGIGDDPETRLLAAIGPSTRILALSWVRFQDGLKLDLVRLGAGCRERGVHLVVDGIQGAGTCLATTDGLAAFATGGHKGLLAPQGQGVLWTHPGFRRQLVPSGSWLSVEEAGDFARPSTDHDRAWLENGERLEAGMPNLLGQAVLLESLRMLNQVGVLALESHIKALQWRLLKKLEASSWAPEVRRLQALRDADRLGSILAFHHGGRGSEALQAFLRKGMRQGLYASVREGYLRIALHGFHTEADVDRVAHWMATA